MTAEGRREKRVRSHWFAKPGSLSAVMASAQRSADQSHNTQRVHQHPKGFKCTGRACRTVKPRAKAAA